MKFKDLRKKYPKFIYESYSQRISGVKPRGGHATLRGKNDLEILFNFKIEPNIQFRPRITVKNIKKNLSRSNLDRLNNLIFNLGLIEMISYWKATCSPEIEIKAGSLNPEQIKWWKDLIMKGMGQFFFENKINLLKPNFPRITTAKAPSENPAAAGFSDGGFLQKYQGNRNKAVLVPVGGGKDSVVSLELLKRFKKNIQCFSLNPTEAASKIMKIAGCKQPIIAKRTIDKKLLELNRRGFLNGHTPFSAYLAFLSVLVATIFGRKYIAFSNERSSNEGNVKYLGKIINHQWSKSFEFEEKFRKYSKKYLVKNIEYFSFLRPLYEIQIAKLFSKYPKYFNAFLSCNEAYKTASGTKKPTKKWCGKCSKCLFVFAILYPFIKEKELLKIFGKNLFENKKLLPIMQQLIGKKGFKPFECVGTKKESLIAFYLSLTKFMRSHEICHIPFLLGYFEEKMLPKYPNIEKGPKRILNSWNTQNNLPKEFKKLLKKCFN